jgi:hypothetical protein
MAARYLPKSLFRREAKLSDGVSKLRPADPGRASQRKTRRWTSTLLVCAVAVCTVWASLVIRNIVSHQVCMQR